MDRRCVRGWRQCCHAARARASRQSSHVRGSRSRVPFLWVRWFSPRPISSRSLRISVPTSSFARCIAASRVGSRCGAWANLRLRIRRASMASNSRAGGEPHCDAAWKLSRCGAKGAQYSSVVDTIRCSGVNARSNKSERIQGHRPNLTSTAHPLGAQSWTNPQAERCSCMSRRSRGPIT